CQLPIAPRALGPARTRALGVRGAGVAMNLQLAHKISDTEAEGPGRRFALWVQGCTLRCEGCCNPELFSSRGGAATDVAQLAEEIARTPGIEGISVLGGEPFEQPAPLVELCRAVR